MEVFAGIESTQYKVDRKTRKSGCHEEVMASFWSISGRKWRMEEGRELRVEQDSRKGLSRSSCAVVHQHKATCPIWRCSTVNERVPAPDTNVKAPAARVYELPVRLAVAYKPDIACGHAIGAAGLQVVVSELDLPNAAGQVSKAQLSSSSVRWLTVPAAGDLPRGRLCADATGALKIGRGGETPGPLEDLFLAAVPPVCTSALGLA